MTTDIDELIRRRAENFDAKHAIDAEVARLQRAAEAYVNDCGYTHKLGPVHQSEQIEWSSLMPPEHGGRACVSVCLNNGVFYDDPLLYLKVYPDDLLKTPEERAAMKAEQDAARKELIARRNASENQQEFEEYLRLKAKYEVTP